MGNMAHDHVTVSWMAGCVAEQGLHAPQHYGACSNIEADGMVRGHANRV